MDCRAASLPGNGGGNCHATCHDCSTPTAGTGPNTAQGSGAGRTQSPVQRAQRAFQQHRAVCPDFAESHTVVTSFCVPECSHRTRFAFCGTHSVHAHFSISEFDCAANSYWYAVT